MNGTKLQTHYRYTGQEHGPAGLPYYDYISRQYDPALGRFLGVDDHFFNYPSYSPYVYVGNNPIILVDPDGRDWYRNQETGKPIWYEGSGAREGYDHIGANFLYEGDQDYLLYLQNDIIRRFPKDQYNKGDIFIVGGKYGMSRNEIFDLGYGNEAFGNAIFRSDLGGDFMKYGVRRAQGDFGESVGWVFDAAMPMPPMLAMIRGMRFFGKGSTQLWTSTSKMSSVKNVFIHWKKHGAQFPEYLNAKQYVQGARNFMHNSPPGKPVII